MKKSSEDRLMAGPNDNELYRQLVKVSENYFGPVTERFLAVQIKYHLHKTPSELTRPDIPKLVDWLGLSLSAISNDTKAINRYTKAVKKLGKR